MQQMHEHNPKYLVLFPYADLWTYCKMAESGIEVKNVYKTCNAFQAAIRKLFFKFNLPFCSIWYGNWKKCFNQYDTIIIFDSAINPQTLEYMQANRAKAMRMIVWYWNPVSHGVDPTLIPDDLFEKWSFDSQDCEMYNMKYNPAFYFQNVSLPAKEAEYDVFFIGKDKGRLSVLLELDDQFQQLNLKTDFHIVRNKPYLQMNNPVLQNPMPYEKVLENIAKSKAILDIVQDNQAGPSLRVMESVFFSKKLITNNPCIEKYDFYNKNNIFMLNRDEIKDLPYFLSTPYQPLHNSVIEKYDIRQWLQRFWGTP